MTKLLAKKFGLPIVDINELAGFLKEKKLKKWRRISGPTLIDSYLKKEELNLNILRFVPQIEVVTFSNPENHPFVGVRNRTADGVVVFTILPGNYIPVCAEFKHGAEEVSINLPGGGNFSGKNPHIQAKKEFEQETGIILKNVTGLSSKGISNDARANANRAYYFIGNVSNPLRVIPRKLDKGEFLETFLISIEDWLKLIGNNGVIDGQSVIATFLALQQSRYFKR